MEKKQLINILSEILIPAGFKRKGNYWVINGEEITKIINLQKSSYGNYFYINYGYIIKSIPLGNLMMHIYNRVSSYDPTEREMMTTLLDLESNISDHDRGLGLKKMLQDNLVSKIATTNTEQDILTELKRRPHLNDITLAVKKHFNLLE